MILILLFVVIDFASCFQPKGLTLWRGSRMINVLGSSVQSDASPPIIGSTKPKPHFRISNDSIDRVLKQVKLSEIVGRHVKLSHSGGGRVVGCCPFHDDRSPSFNVDDDKGLYHCFGCGAGGNAIKFIMEQERMNFIDTMLYLAEEFNVKIDYGEKILLSENMRRYESQATSKDAKIEMFRALKLAAEFYAQSLSSCDLAGNARAHLIAKNITPNTARGFQLGYSSHGVPCPVVEHLRDHDVSTETMISSGLVFNNTFSGTSSLVDIFRGRLTIPVKDHSGNIIGFGARCLPNFDRNGNYTIPQKVPKYLNSPETILFHKGSIVYGLESAQRAIKDEDLVVIVEGYFDVLALHDVGIHFVVGCLGTSISQKQLELASRYSRSRRIILCMDMDNPGQMAVEKLCENGIFENSASKGIDIRVANISSSSFIIKDPSDFVCHHGENAGELFRTEVLQEAKPWTVWFGDKILSEYNYKEDASAFKACVNKVTSFLKILKSPTDRTYHAYRFAAALGGDNISLRLQLESDLISQVENGEKKLYKLPPFSEKPLDVESSGGSVGNKISENHSRFITARSTPWVRTKQARIEEIDMEPGKKYTQLPPRPKIFNASLNLFSQKKLYGKTKLSRRSYDDDLYAQDILNQLDNRRWQQIDYNRLQLPKHTDTKINAENYLLGLIVTSAEDRKKCIETVVRYDLAGTFSSPQRRWLLDSLINLPLELQLSNSTALLDYLMKQAPCGYQNSTSHSEESHLLEEIFTNFDASKISVISTELILEDALLVFLKAQAVGKVEKLLRHLDDLSLRIAMIKNASSVNPNCEYDVELLNQLVIDQSEAYGKMIEAQNEVNEREKQRYRLNQYIHDMQLKHHAKEDRFNNDIFQILDGELKFVSDSEEPNNVETSEKFSVMRTQDFERKLLNEEKINRFQIAAEYDDMIQNRSRMRFNFEKDIPYPAETGQFPNDSFLDKREQKFPAFTDALHHNTATVQ